MFEIYEGEEEGEGEAVEIVEKFPLTKSRGEKTWFIQITKNPLFLYLTSN